MCLLFLLVCLTKPNPATYLPLVQGDPAYFPPALEQPQQVGASKDNSSSDESSEGGQVKRVTAALPSLPPLTLTLPNPGVAQRLQVAQMLFICCAKYLIKLHAPPATFCSAWELVHTKLSEQINVAPSSQKELLALLSIITG